MRRRFFPYTGVVLAGLLIASPLFAQVMQSTNYKIERDSINVGGGFSSSTNYTQENTVGESGTGFSSSTNYQLVDAGYQQGGNYIAITSVADVTMSPSLGGVSGGTANGSTVVTVTTDNAAGYQLSITSSSSPSMQSGASTIPDYTPTGANPDFTFSNAASESQFGFSPEGTDIADRYRDDGASCNTDTGDTASACWDGLSTTPTTIASRTTANHPAGTDTTLRFRVAVGAGAAQAEGVYVATTTVTALPN